VGRYRVLIKRPAKKELLAVSTKRDRQRIVQGIQALDDDPLPTGCQKLSGYDRYRLPQGRYCVVYEVRDAEVVVVVIRIGHRRDVYRVR
jgi:mRNA interferase RelE/StbE